MVLHSIVPGDAAVVPISGNKNQSPRLFTTIFIRWCTTQSLGLLPFFEACWPNHSPRDNYQSLWVYSRHCKRIATAFINISAYLPCGIYQSNWCTMFQLLSYLEHMYNWICFVLVEGRALKRRSTVCLPASPVNNVSCLFVPLIAMWLEYQHLPSSVSMHELCHLRLERNSCKIESWKFTAISWTHYLITN